MKRIVLFVLLALMVVAGAFAQRKVWTFMDFSGDRTLEVGRNDVSGIEINHVEESTTGVVIHYTVTSAFRGNVRFEVEVAREYHHDFPSMVTRRRWHEDEYIVTTGPKTVWVIVPYSSRINTITINVTR